jgi:hypothetical protein
MERNWGCHDSLFLERSVQRQQSVVEEARTRNKIHLEEVNGVRWR